MLLILLGVEQLTTKSVLFGLLVTVQGMYVLADSFEIG